MMTLGRALHRHGHRITVFQIPEMRTRIEAEQLEFRPLGEVEGAGEIARAVSEIGRRSGLSALRLTLDYGRRLAALICRHGPEAVRSAGVDLLLVDDNEPAGGSVAQHLGLPYINLGLIPLHREPAVPPPFVPWSYGGNQLSRARNQLAYRIFDRLVAGINGVLNEYRAQWKLPLIRYPEDTLSPFAQLSQLVEELDYPRTVKPDYLHYLGALFDANRPSAPFPFEKLQNRPLIYASFGTLQNGRVEPFRAVAEACAQIDAQTVLSAGSSAHQLTNLPGSPIVVSYAPQLALLARASLCITHGGVNTVMESLRFAVPMIAVPITNDQPAVAARVRWTGAGEMAPLPQLLKGGLKPVLAKVWNTPSYREAAGRLQAAVLSAGGVERGVAIVQQVLRTGKPVQALAKEVTA
jgi:UDP:flavonoid glycosyltransferase YjiC (YdhE family)